MNVLCQYEQDLSLTKTLSWTIMKNINMNLIKFEINIVIHGRDCVKLVTYYRHDSY